MSHSDVKKTVPLATRIGWGFGGLADNYIMNVLNVMFLFMYTDHFKMPAMLAGAALAVPRFFDAVTDPLIGNLSDNTRSRWGRRRPYILCGALLSAILLPFFWMPPGLETVRHAQWWKNIPFLYVSALGMIYAFTYTLFVVPYTALGYELTEDYDERTRVLAWRMYIGLIGGVTIPSVLALAQIDAFESVSAGAVTISSIVALIIFCSGLIPAWVCRERPGVQKQETIGFFRAARITLTNRPFLILLAAYIIVIVGLFSAGNLGAFLNIYYICGGNKDFGTLMVGIAGALGAAVSYLSMFLITAVSARTGKKTGMIGGLILALGGVIISWFAMDPRWPLAQLISTAVACMGLQGCWLMVSSMVADICDEDELKTGLRREGMFGAVNGFALKAALALTALIGAYLLETSGFSADAVDRFEERTIADVIEPVRTWNFDDPGLSRNTELFLKSADRFEQIAADKSAIEGSSWTAFWRLLQGEKVFFRWMDFEEAVSGYLFELDSAGLKTGYIESVRSGFLMDYARQKNIAYSMKKLVVGFQAAGLVVAIGIFVFYPITRKRAEETRRILNERASGNT